MAEPSGPSRDERTVAWTVMDPKLRTIATQLPVRLRRQAQWMAVALVIGMLFGAMGMLLGLATIGTGLSFHIWNFLTRGVAIIAISVIVIFATWPLQRTVSLDATQALSQLIDLAIEHGQKTLSLVRAGLCCCIIAAVFGLAGNAIRTHFGRPPRMSPTVPLAILALIGFGVVIWGRQTRLELGKYRRLKQALPGRAAA